VITGESLDERPGLASSRVPDIAVEDGLARVVEPVGTLTDTVGDLTQKVRRRTSQEGPRAVSVSLAARGRRTGEVAVDRAGPVGTLGHRPVPTQWAGLSPGRQSHHGQGSAAGGA
jgi:hypothetical protein